MKFRTLAVVLPALFLVKLTACSDQEVDPRTRPSANAPLPAGTTGEEVDPDAIPGGRGSCSVTRPGSTAVLLKGRLLLPQKAIDGELLLDERGTILCAAEACEAAPPYAEAAAYLATYRAATEITCKRAVVSPGLINPHDHISFANTSPRSHGTERYEHRHDWRKGLRGHTKIRTEGTASANAVRAAELRFVMSGATATAGVGGQPGLLRNVDSAPQFLEGAGMKLADSDTFPLGDSSPTASWPYFACVQFPATRRTASQVASQTAYLPHISEGIDAIARLEFFCQSDSESDAAHDLLAKQTAIVHGVGLQAEDIAKYRDTQTALVWSPRSNVDLYGNTAPVVLYDNLGVQIALGTDWLASGSMNMARELRCAADLNDRHFGRHFTDQALWKMVTQNAAFAVGAKDTLGMLKPGYAGDVAVFSAGAAKDYRAVIDANPDDVILVLRSGRPLYGDAALLAQEGLGADECEDIDVCGIAKKACVKKDTGAAALADLVTQAEAIYPLFFCRGQTPTDEPSCMPYRGPTLSSITASVYTTGPREGDRDGDGVADDSDNCPSVFNPVRPIDIGQSDADGDGIGDACDRCPFIQGESCTPPSADDIDADGVPNGDDNCAELANADQTDLDRDGKGDACDACPTDANPGQARCVTDHGVQALRNPSDPAHPPAGATRARVRDLYVTAIRTTGGRGFYAQSGTEAFSGLFVETGTTPRVTVGNRVEVVGDYEEVFGITTLRNVVVTVSEPRTTLPFSPVTVTTASVTNADAAQGVDAERYESMLCQIEGVSVTVVNADDPADFDEFSVADASGQNLRVDDQLDPGLDNTYAVGTPFQRIVGICGLSYSNRKIWPRSSADLIP